MCMYGKYVAVCVLMYSQVCAGGSICVYMWVVGVSVLSVYHHLEIYFTRVSMCVYACLR